jgi:hypothetical protein
MVRGIQGGYINHAQFQYDQHKECVDVISLIIENENRQHGKAQTSAPEIRHLAYDLHKIAPDLAQEAGLVFEAQGFNDTVQGRAILQNAKDTDTSPSEPVEMTPGEAAPILNMQTIQELNNNWESRFPENEKVWDFAHLRVERSGGLLENGEVSWTKSEVEPFFSVRRFPVCCQSQATQEEIRNSGVMMQEKEKVPTAEEMEERREEMMRRRNEKPKEIYRGSGCNLPFRLGRRSFKRGF